MRSFEPVEIVPGAYQIRLPLPIRNLDHVYVYLFCSGSDNLLIDSGWNSDECFEALSRSLQIIGLPVAELKKVLVSHLHPDHFGLVGRIKKESLKCRIMMHKEEASNIKKNRKEYSALMIRLHEWLRTNGTPQSEVESMLSNSLALARTFDKINGDEVLVGGEALKVGSRWRFRVLHTPGHTSGTICLLGGAKDDDSSKMFFSGDHILPSITPNISLSPLYTTSEDPLGDYLSSIRSLKAIRASRVLPSHEHVFSNLSKRISEIERHHKFRLQNTLNVLNREDGLKGLTAYETASHLRWHGGGWSKLDPWERRAAVLETLAHLEYLKIRGLVAKVETRTRERKRESETTIYISSKRHEWLREECSEPK